MAAQGLTFAQGNRALLFIALAAGLIAAVIVFIVVSEGGDDGSSPAASGTVPTLVAAQSISAGDEITEDMVKLTDIPQDLVISGAYEEADKELVVGEVSRVAIAEGEQFTSAKIGLAVPDKGLPGVVPPGMRAVALEVDEVTAVGGNLLPGDRIDINVVIKIGRAPGLAEDEYILRATTILQNVEVLSVAQEAQTPVAQTKTEDEDATSDPSVTSGELPEDVDQQPDAQTLTLALSPADALLLIGAQEQAERVWAVARAFGDDAIVEVAPYDQVIVDESFNFGDILP